MPTKKYPPELEQDVVVVPLPQSVIDAFGCRPGTMVRLHVVDGQIRAAPYQAPTPRVPTVANMAEACRQWWKTQCR